jgi:hypothetical protein
LKKLEELKKPVEGAVCGSFGGGFGKVWEISKYEQRAANLLFVSNFVLRI